MSPAKSRGSAPDGWGNLATMKVEDIKNLAERTPFRPFAVRVNNGVHYMFSKPRSIGAPEDYHMIFFFGESEWAMIETESIVEIIQR